MALIPLKQEVTVKKSDYLNEWGKEVPGDGIVYKCRVDEGSFLVKSKNAGGTTSSKEVVAQARILLDKLADVHEEDTINYTNELGFTISKKPEKINVKRHLNGKPLLTEVYI